MSIWCSGSHIGTDPRNWKDLDGTPIPKAAERGNVLSYAEGFSNHFPDLTGSHERPAVIALADIAPWCVPGHDETCKPCGTRHDYPDTGPWLRLEVAAPEVMNFWTKDADGNPTIETNDATVILDRDAAAALRDDLTNWLARPHLEPIEGAACIETAKARETHEVAPQRVAGVGVDRNLTGGITGPQIEGELL